MYRNNLRTDLHFLETEYEITEDTRFKAYCKAVEAVFKDEPLTLRALHEQLGESANKRLTLDALKYLSDVIESDGKIPAKYYKRNRRRIEGRKWNDGVKPSDEKYHRAEPRGVLNSGIK